MKVIISDDEPRVCQLVENLVDWSQLDMTIESVAYNGIDAMEAIRVCKPDIVITDIRMPGIDGLELIKAAKELNPDIEFIIISGFRHFEYAQNAIKYGVMDYLLKPIKKEELYQTLLKVKENFLQRTEKLSREEEYHQLVKNNLDLLRADFLETCLEKRQSDTIDLEFLNEKYHYGFKPGIFQVLSIKLDGLDLYFQENLAYIQEKTLQKMKRYLSPLCWENEFLFHNMAGIGVLNYRNESFAMKEVRKAVKQSLKELLFQKDIFENLSVTIGIGIPVGTVQDLFQSRVTALRAVEDRLIKGVNQVIEGEKKSERSFAYTETFTDFNKRFMKALEWQDEKEVQQSIIDLKCEMKMQEGLSGHQVLQMAKEIVNIYGLTMKQNKLEMENEETFFDKTVNEIDNFGTMEGIFGFLAKTIGISFHQAIEKRKEDHVRPIREGKTYIQKHYCEPLSLEIVSKELGFNATYFSGLFKKETGLTFLEYLTEVRMEAAKEFLRDTDWTIVDICEKVGYKDPKYFSKSFRKFTGLKPNEYRKIYS